MHRIMIITKTANEMYSTIVSVGLLVTMPTLLSTIASSLAIFWWLWKIYDKVKNK